jgi:hypothetical protein
MAHDLSAHKRKLAREKNRAEITSMMSAEHPTKRSGEREQAKIRQTNRQLEKPEVVDEAKESTSTRDSRAERAGRKVARDLEYDMGHRGKDDNKAERAGKKVTKDIEYDEKHIDEAKESNSKRDSRAERAGKKVTKDLEYDMKHKGKDDTKAERAGKRVTKDIEYDEKHKVNEGKFSTMDADLADMAPKEFKEEYGMTKAEARAKHGAAKPAAKTPTKKLDEMDNPDWRDDIGKKEIMAKPITVKKMKKDAEKAMNKAFRKEIPKKKVKESSDFAEWDASLKSILSEGAMTTHSVMHNGFARKSSTTPTVSPKQRTDEGLADLIAMLQNAGMSADAMQNRSAQVPPAQTPGTLEIDFDDGKEIADNNAEDYAASNSDTEWDGTGSVASPTNHADGSDPHSKFHDAEDVPVMAMPRGMGMSQNTENTGQFVEIEPVMADEVISDLQSASDDSGDSTLDFIKKTMNHGEASVKVTDTAASTQPAPYGDSASADYEDEMGESDNYAATQGAGQTGTSAGQMSMLPEEDDEEVEEGNAFSGARAEAQKNHQDSFEVGNKTFPVKEEEQYTTTDGDNDEESHEVDSDATRDAGLAVGHPMGASNGSPVSETEVDVDHQSKKPSEMSLKDFIAKLDQITANRNNPLEEGSETCNECGGAMYEGQDSHRCKTMESKKAKPDFLDVDKDGDKKESFKKASKESTEKKDEKAEKAGKKVAKDIEYDEDHKGKDDDKAEKAGKKVTKDIEYDDKKDEVDESIASFKTLLGRVMNTATLTPVASLTEWANTPSQSKEEHEQFTTDVDFMTRSISGGLNNQKVDQTTLGQGPVRVRTQSETQDVNQSMGALLKKLGGIN